MITEYEERYRMMGLRIAYYRKLRGFTQESFAEKVGRRGISLETLFKISDVLGIQPGKLLDAE